MMKKQKSFDDLTDEEVLREFVKRFKCDGAVLIYHEAKEEFGFGRWRNTKGKQWVNSVLKAVQDSVISQKALSPKK